MSNIISQRTRINVGGQVFDIPSEKVSELIRLLAQWQSLSVSENSNNPEQKWNGNRLILG